MSEVQSMKLKYKEQIMGSMVKTHEETIYLFKFTKWENVLQLSPGLISRVYILYSSPHVLDTLMENEVKEAETQRNWGNRRARCLAVKYDTRNSCISCLLLHYSLLLYLMSSEVTRSIQPLHLTSFLEETSADMSGKGTQVMSR